MLDSVTIAKGTRSPSITDTIMVDNAPFDLTGSTVKFRMRRADSTVLLIDSAASIVNSPGTDGEVRYNWGVGDTATEGEYRGWFSITLASGLQQDAPEFIVLIDAHAPGEAVIQGAVASQARQYLPVTWDALSQDQRYGDRFLQARVDTVKYRLFATVVNAVAEATTYDLFVLDFMGKVAVLQIIPAGIEYWSDRHISVSTTGTSEVVSYPDRLKSLQALQEWLTVEVAKDWQDVQAILPFKIRRKGKFPKVSDTDPLLTASPKDFPSEYGGPVPSNVYVPFPSTWRP